MKTLSVGLLLHALVPAFWANILARLYLNPMSRPFHLTSFAKSFAVMLFYFGLSIALFVLAARMAASRTELEHGGGFVVLAGLILIAMYSTLYMVLSAYNVVGQIPDTRQKMRKSMTRLCLGAAILVILGSAAFPPIES
jgi:hypothetical protein